MSVDRNGSWLVASGWWLSNKQQATSPMPTPTFIRAIGKKGFFFYAEVIIVVIFVTLIWLQFPASQQSYLDLSAQENLRAFGYTQMKALDTFGILPKYINQTNFSASNFTQLDAHIKNSLPNTILGVVEYQVNGTSCHNSSGSLGKCGINSTSPDTTVAVYTFSNSTDPVSVRLYLRNVFGGRQ